MKVIGLVLRGARYKDEVLEVGDLAIHDEEAFPDEGLATRTGGAFDMAGIGVGAVSPPSAASSPDEPSGRRL
jgi:Amt family ammonium transporter